MLSTISLQLITYVSMLACLVFVTKLFLCKNRNYRDSHLILFYGISYTLFISRIVEIVNFMKIWSTQCRYWNNQVITLSSEEICDMSLILLGIVHFHRLATIWCDVTNQKRTKIMIVHSFSVLLVILGLGSTVMAFYYLK